MNVSPAASSACGSGRLFFNDAVTTVAQIKVSPGQIYWLMLVNTTAATAYLQIFCKQSSQVTLGTTAPDFTIRLPTNAASGFIQPIAFPVPIGWFTVGGTPGSGLSVAATTTPTGATGAAISVAAVYS